MDSCQEVGIDTCLRSSLLKTALLMLLFSPLLSFAMQAEMCLQRCKRFKLKEDYFKIKCDDSFLLHIYIKKKNPQEKKIKKQKQSTA